MLLDRAQTHIQRILKEAMRVSSETSDAVLVYDSESELSALLAQAYRQALPQARHLAFESHSPEAILSCLEKLQPGNLAVLVQSSSFRLNAFRLRVELFKRGLKVIEHPHLGRMQGEEVARYVEALAYDRSYLQSVGRGLKTLLDQAQEVSLIKGKHILKFASPMESTKLNIGDYSGMPNVGGQFPIGEVFTEAQDLTAVGGAIPIFAFGDTSFRVQVPDQPIELHISQGRVVEVRHSCAAFEEVMDLIRRDEGEIWVRELGLGLNKAFSPTRVVSDIGTFERMCGVHLSLGQKHTVYPKPMFNRRKGGYHVDVFPLIDEMRIDGRTVFQGDAWVGFQS